MSETPTPIGSSMANDTFVWWCEKYEVPGDSPSVILGGASNSLIEVGKEVDATIRCRVCELPAAPEGAGCRWMTEKEVVRRVRNQPDYDALLP